MEPNMNELLKEAHGVIAALQKENVELKVKLAEKESHDAAVKIAMDLFEQGAIRKDDISAKVEEIKAQKISEKDIQKVASLLGGHLKLASLEGDDQPAETDVKDAHGPLAAAWMKETGRLPKEASLKEQVAIPITQ